MGPHRCGLNSLRRVFILLIISHFLFFSNAFHSICINYYNIQHAVTWKTSYIYIKYGTWICRYVKDAPPLMWGKIKYKPPLTYLNCYPSSRQFNFVAIGLFWAKKQFSSQKNCHAGIFFPMYPAASKSIAGFWQRPLSYRGAAAEFKCHKCHLSVISLVFCEILC